ncbi:MAG: hypothetical protein WAU81_15015 [Candidatus Aminicenantales bacterium]
MWCFIHKWKISRAIDSGKPPAGLTKRHLERCGSCREFSRLSGELEKRLAGDAAALIGSTDATLAGRVMPNMTAGSAVESLAPAPSQPKFFRLRPVWAAAASLVIVVGISLIWILTSHPAKMPPLDPLFKLAGPRAYIESALQKAEAPYQEEVLEFKQALQSTADYLVSRLDVKLGPEN